MAEAFIYFIVLSVTAVISFINLSSYFTCLNASAANAYKYKYMDVYRVYTHVYI